MFLAFEVIEKEISSCTLHTENTPGYFRRINDGKLWIIVNLTSFLMADVNFVSNVHGITPSPAAMEQLFWKFAFDWSNIRKKLGMENIVK